MIGLKDILLENQIEWKTPNLDGAQNSIKELSDELFISKKNIVNSFKHGKIVYLKKSKIDQINNVNISNIQSYLEVVDFIQKKQKSNPEYVRDWISIRNGLRSNQPMEAPIVMKYKNEYYLLDGQIRLMVAKILNVPIKVYVFYYQG